jgi:hypothetical protein
VNDEPIQNNSGIATTIPIDHLPSNVFGIYICDFPLCSHLGNLPI